MKSEKHRARLDSNISECEKARQARKARKVESWESGNLLCSTTIQELGVFIEKVKHYVQLDSNISEWFLKSAGTIIAKVSGM